MQATGITHQSKAKSLQGDVFVACFALTQVPTKRGQWDGMGVVLG